MENIVTTQQEILKAIHENAEKTDHILIAVNAFAEKTDERFDNIESHLKEHDERLDHIESQLIAVESQMVTKEYLDDKLADLRGDLVVLMRKEDTKLKTLVEILCQRNVITKEEMNQVIAKEPFAQIV